MGRVERAAEREGRCLHCGERESGVVGIMKWFYYKSLEHVSMKNTLERGRYCDTLDRMGGGGILNEGRL